METKNQGRKLNKDEEQKVLGRITRELQEAKRMIESSNKLVKYLSEAGTSRPQIESDLDDAEHSLKCAIDDLTEDLK